MIDIFGVWLAVIGAYFLTQGEVNFPRARADTDQRIAYASLLVVLMFSLRGLYRSRSRRGNAPRAIAVISQAFLGLIAIRVLLGKAIGSYALLGWAYIFTCVTVTSMRGAFTGIAIKVANRARGGRKRCLLLGSREQCEPVAAVMRDHDSESEVVGFVGNDHQPLSRAGLRRLARTASDGALARVIAAHEVDELIMCDPTASEHDAGRIAHDAWRAGARLRAVAPTRDFLVAVSRYTPGEALPVEELRMPVFDGSEYAIKRAFDIAGAGVLLLLMAVPMTIIAIGVKLSMPRATLVERLGYPGRGGKELLLLKFRTRDPVGARDVPWFMRAISTVGLDELPQLVNVLRGEMSLVGPRPVSKEDHELLDRWQQMRNEILPGVTGLWQISGRHDTSVAPMVLLDLYYIQRWSLALDVEILLKTAWAAVRNRRATLDLPPSGVAPTPRFTERRAPFAARALDAMSGEGGLDFDGAARIARIAGRDGADVLHWLNRLYEIRWIDIFEDGDEHTFVLNSYGISELQADRRASSDA